MLTYSWILYEKGSVRPGAVGGAGGAETADGPERGILEVAQAVADLGELLGSVAAAGPAWFLGLVIVVNGTHGAHMAHGTHGTRENITPYVSQDSTNMVGIIDLKNIRDLSLCPS